MKICWNFSWLETDIAQIVQIPPHRRHRAVYCTKQYHGPLTRQSSRHSRRMRNPQFYASGKRPMALLTWWHKRQWNVALNIPVSAPEGLRSYQKINRNMIYSLYSRTKTVCVECHQAPSHCLKQRWYHLDHRMILPSEVLSQILMRKFSGSSMVFGWRLPLTISNPISPGMAQSTTPSSSRE